jgi:hypothetical protein
LARHPAKIDDARSIIFEIARQNCHAVLAGFVRDKFCLQYTVVFVCS